ncbi:sugar nucleotide-binding protein [Candidatus Omnitrophota bacterium]
MQNSDRILITGITSIHGWPIFSRFREKYGERVYGVSPDNMSHFFKNDKKVFFCNMEKLSQMGEIFDKVKPKAVVHAGGVCDLDRCESSPDFAYEINVLGTRNVVSLSRDSYLLYISTDLVFSGNDPDDCGYSELSPCDPVSVIGRTFVEAENEILQHQMSGIMRLGLPIGPSISGTKGPIDFIAKRLSKNRPMTLFHDEIRSLITTGDLALAVSHLFDKKGVGIFHCGGPQEYSLYDIGAYLIEERGYKDEYLIRSSRFNEKNGPPRIGRVTLDSKKFCEFTGFTPSDALTPLSSEMLA